LLAADLQIRPLLPSDSLDQRTDLTHRAFVSHLSHGLRFVGTYQTVEVTSERLAPGTRLLGDAVGKTK
jgi:hypothetical protein